MKTPSNLDTASVVLLILLSSVPIRAADETIAVQPDQFLQQWTVLGPIPAFIEGGPRTANAAKRKSFDVDLLKEAGGEASAKPSVGAEVTIRGKSLKWARHSSESDEIDLKKAVGEHEWSIAYAFANVHSEQATLGVLGIGSDDAVRIWLNGELLHDNWASRSLRQDDDLVPVKLRKGANQLLLKVLNRKYTWGFTCRVLSDELLARKFVTAGMKGKLDRAKLLLASGVQVDATNAFGLTAYQGAKIRGYDKLASWLAESGADTQRSFADPKSYVDAILQDESRPNQPGVAVLVSRGGKVLFSKGYGLANTTNNISISPKTKFRIGSVTKQFAAAAILKLQEEGKLSVTDKLTKFIPDYPRGDEVTLHHLLTHTSGITSYTSKADFYEHVTEAIEPEALIASFKNDEIDFAPGEKFSYSNSGYFLLGHIVAKISGKSFDEYLKDTFFEPLGMKDSGIHRADLNLPHEAKGYSFVDSKFQDALNWDMSRAGAAGAIYSTVEDLQRWNEGVFGGKVLQPKSLVAAFTKAQTKANDNTMSYGYGWMVGEQRGLQKIHHSGGLQGFSSYLARFPKQNLTIAVLHNALPGSGDLEPVGIAAIIAEAYLWKEMTPRSSYEVDETVDPKSFLALVGEYDYVSATMTVTTEDNRLFAQLTGQAKMEIFPASPSKFFWKAVEAHVEFLRDVDDKVIAVEHTQNGQSFKAAKLKAEKTVKIEAKILDSYVGTYDFGAVGKLIVTRKGDHLSAKLASQPAVDVYGKSETKFFYKVIRAELEFVKGHDGKIEKVILRQGPAKLDGTRID
ncbi:MAG: serine hydrolase [Planctomycetes bacterium]|nr:serine hydrolase [Planctomycetota bacterium]